ncbi:iron chelate uptake ABC transporter family permease subunit [Deinococcus detaillensis]|uniref:iron chelate uptake ABC transporter family permease subunit n=1 Tax=Deinococcus detaillensis TaxID=2592048 RepID=UPI001CDB64FE|nr:iron chelate uptake ABC transporter family permease subunit [Deinococcus detaillensis]
MAHLLFFPDDSTDSLVVHALWLQRTLVAGLAGAGLAVSGLLLYSVTRNPLADPGILGVEAGGALAGAGIVGLLGALLMLATDTLSRALLPPLEAPAGIFTTLVGAPYFLYLLRRSA